jgi:hypothetical protein
MSYFEKLKTCNARYKLEDLSATLTNSKLKMKEEVIASKPAMEATKYFNYFRSLDSRRKSCDLNKR